ncbi:MAG: ATP synthase F1 subunit gamma [Acidobacteriia bacterium]|nr:ATP synthase F1 subunit gamma [Terriglobia bacterium]
MANLLDIRRRIRSVKNTRQITKAMQMVSAAKLRRAQERAMTARPYAQMITSVLKSLVSRAEIYDPQTGEVLHPLLVRRPENSITLIVVSGEKGLAGAFNANILKEAARFIASRQGKQIDIVAVGRKSREYFRRRYPVAVEGEPRKGPIQVVSEYVGLLNRVHSDSADKIAEFAIGRYTGQTTDAVYLVYNEFKSVIAQRLVTDHVLPVGRIGDEKHEITQEMSEEARKQSIEAAMHAGVGVRPADTKAIDQKAAAFGSAQVDYIYEQPPKELFNSLLPRYVSVQLFRAMLESEAAEHAARMTAMDAATNNAADMIDALTLAMNRARQAKITREIIEIVSGAAAL